MPETRTLERPDGRVVVYASWGDPAGRPLLLLHGTPGSRLSRSPDAELYARLHAHVVTFDRPGYGLPRHPCRSDPTDEFLAGLRSMEDRRSRTRRIQ